MALADMTLPASPNDDAEAYDPNPVVPHTQSSFASTTQHTSDTGSTILWRVACNQSRGLATLRHIPVHEGESGQDVMETLRHDFTKSRLVCLFNLIFLFREQGIMEASLRVISFSSDAEAQSNDRHIQVSVESTQPSNVLTAAFYRPSLLAFRRDFVTVNKQYALSTTSGTTSRDDPLGAILVGWTTRKEYIAYFLAAIVLLSVGAGVVVGFLSRDASVGLAASSGFAGVLSCVEVLVFWQLS